MQNLFFGESSSILEICTKSTLLKDNNYKLNCCLTVNAEAKLFFQAEYSFMIRPNNKKQFLTLFYLRKIISGNGANTSYDEIDVILNDAELNEFLNNPSNATIGNVYKKINKEYSFKGSKKIKSLFEIAEFDLFDSKVINWIILNSTLNIKRADVEKMMKSADSKLIM
jgi:hypothetical protein